MNDQPLTDSAPEPTPALGESRARVLELLRGAADPVSVQDIATSTGLHPNTARFHLDGLVEAGLASRGREDGGRPGRPRTVYRATTTRAADGKRSYRLLAEMLTSVVTGSVPQARNAAVEAGRMWGRYLVERPAPSEQVDADDALRRLTRVLTEAGFAPDPVAGGQPRVVGLRQCPFREIAEHNQDVVCSLHLGMMQGALAEVRAPLTADRLEPFAEPSLCLAHLGTTPPEPAAR